MKYVILILIFLSTPIAVWAAHRPQLDIAAVIKDLAKCESSNIPTQVTFNDGKDHTASYGLLQFKVSTWLWAQHRYGYKNLDIMNGDNQKMIAGKMLDEGRWKNWYVCLHKVYQ